MATAKNMVVGGGSVSTAVASGPPLSTLKQGEKDAMIKIIRDHWLRSRSTHINTNKVVIEHKATRVLDCEYKDDDSDIRPYKEAKVKAALKELQQEGLINENYEIQ